MNSTTNNQALATLRINTFFPSLGGCLKYNNYALCNYSSLMVVCGHIIQLCVFPALIFRMSNLTKRFRNQYNISFLWLCSILLISSIDLLEFIIVGNGQIYTSLTVILISIYFVLGLVTIMKYMRNYSINAVSYQNGITMIFSLCIFSLIFFARIWSSRTLSKFPNLSHDSPTAFYLLNTYFFLYYFVYVMFATVQVIHIHYLLFM